jgi:uncharacterized protein
MNDYPYYVPAFSLEINDQPVPTALRSAISGLNFQSALEGADRVEISIVNLGLRWLDDPLLALDNKVKLSIGYAPDTPKQVFVGEIVSKTAAFPSSGVPTMTIAAQDRINRLQKGTKTRWFAIPIRSHHYPIPDEETVNIVALENQLVAVFDPVSAALQLIIGGTQLLLAVSGNGTIEGLIRKQDGQSDFDFLKRIAADFGWEMTINHGGDRGGYELHFLSPMENIEPELTLRYGQSLIEFTPRITNVGEVLGISVSLRVPDTGLQFTITVSYNWDRQSLDITITPEYEPRGRRGGQSGSSSQSGAGASQANGEQPNITSQPESSDAPPGSSSGGEQRQAEQECASCGSEETPAGDTGAGDAIQSAEGEEAADTGSEAANGASASPPQTGSEASSEERDSENGQGSSLQANAQVTIAGEPVTLESAPRKILSKLLPKLNQRLTGSGSTVGNPRILAGAVLRMEGLGKEFSGLYRVTSATHTLDSGGYRTSFEVRKEIWFGSAPEGEGFGFTFMGQQIG